MKNQVQLITYVDRLGGGGINALATLLDGPLRGLFGCVHLLPFFNPIDGSDAGFDPIDHTQVDPRLGTWADIKGLAAGVDVMADVIVNHMSSSSPQFIDFVRNGSASKYDGLFLTRDRVFPAGVNEADLGKIYRPRPGLPFREVTLDTGEVRTLWTTFTPQQIDIDVGHALGREYLGRILQTFSANDISHLRLDAVGYAIKQAGTSCFMTPATFAFIGEFSDQVRRLGMDVLVEVHSYYREQIEIAKQVDWVYDFALPPLVLHAFRFRTASGLKDWIAVRPENALTVLDTHDGIGIVDIGPDGAGTGHGKGLVPDDELSEVVESIHVNSKGQSRQATGATASNLDLYQVNCTYYDALARDDVRYLLARAIQFFLPGIPQVYYVGLLAGTNDMELLARTRVGRDINRHYYDDQEIAEALARPVVAGLLRLIRFRNTHPAFSGKFALGASASSVLEMQWSNGSEFAHLRIDFNSGAHFLRHSEQGNTVEFDLLSTQVHTEPTG